MKMALEVIQKDGSYRAYITFRHKQYHLGVYASLEEAASARKEAEKNSLVNT